MDTGIIKDIVISAIPILFAVVFHEVAHGWTARYNGDNTAWQEGRLSLNPLKHVDPVGTILVPIVLYSLFKIPFGWARPVPINWANLRHPRRDIILVAAAGPAANLVMSIFWAVLLKLATLSSAYMGAYFYPLAQMCIVGISINIVLMVFNLLPLPPLDGGRIATMLLPHPWRLYLARVEPFGLFIILALLATGWLWPIIFPGIQFIGSLIQALVGL